MKKITLLACSIALCLLTALTKAQTPQAIKNNESLNLRKIDSGVPDIYTYKVFQAPNKLYGYDIFKNGRGIFHQTVPANVADALAIHEKRFAEKAAVYSIEKLKNKNSASLSPQEIKNIISQ